ncbi:hypothetical protein VE04_02110, partial [Pseudogymnoascus sp. 24MN13]
MALDMSHQTSGSPPNTPTESSWPVAIPEEFDASTSMLSERFGIPTIMRPSQPLGGVPYPARPGWDASALGEEQQDMSGTFSYVDQVMLQFADQPNNYNTFLQILRDYRSQVIGYPVMASRMSKLFAGHPNLIPGFNIYLPAEYRIECSSTNDPNTICATGRPVTRSSLTPMQTEQSAGINGVSPQQSGAAQAKPAAATDVRSFDLSTTMVQCNTSMPVPQRLAISIQPPEATRPGTELFPPIEVRLLQPEDMPNVWAIVMLLNNGTDVTYQLGGELYQSPNNDGTFCFPGLAILEEGMYRLRIFLYHMDFDSCPKGVAQVGRVDSNDIIIEPRPDFTTIFGSIGDVTTAQVSVAQPLLWQTVDANKCIDDHTGYFPNLKIHASSSVIIRERIEYPKYMVFIPVSDFMLETA